MEKADNEERQCREEAHFQGHYPQVCMCALYLCTCSSVSCFLVSVTDVVSEVSLVEFDVVCCTFWGSHYGSQKCCVVLWLINGRPPLSA